MKKFIILLVMSIFLIGAVSFISAAEDFDDVIDSSDNYVDSSVGDNYASDDNAVNSNEKVKLTITMDWKDNGGSNRPTSVTVYVKNGENTVETVVLSKDNGWSKTVDVDKSDSNGNQISYSVSADKIGGYKEPVVKSKGNDFTITNELNGALSSSGTDFLKENNSDNSGDNGTDNGTDDNSTADDNNASDNNKTDHGGKTNTTINNSTNITINKNTKVNNTTINQVIVKKPPKETPKNDSKKQDKKKPLLNTGNPILILVIVIIIVAVVYYFYSKR